jgi:hypothetical protein
MGVTARPAAVALDGTTRTRPFNEIELLSMHSALNDAYAGRKIDLRAYAMAWVFLAYGRCIARPMANAAAEGYGRLTPIGGSNGSGKRRPGSSGAGEEAETQALEATRRGLATLRDDLVGQSSFRRHLAADYNAGMEHESLEYKIVMDDRLASLDIGSAAYMAASRSISCAT